MTVSKSIMASFSEAPRTLLPKKTAKKHTYRALPAQFLGFTTENPLVIKKKRTQNQSGTGISA